MSHNSTQFFSTLKHDEPPATLYTHIIERITKLKRRAVRTRLGAFIVVGVGVITTSAALVVQLASEFAHSGFLQYASLILTDRATVLADWRVFTLSLVEAFPVMSVTMVLVALFILLGMLRYIVRDIAVLRQPHLIS